MRIILTIFISSILFLDSAGQNLVFEDAGLKHLLVSENCMSTDEFAAPEINIDLDGDQEISMEEALAVDNLYLNDYNSENGIFAIQDLNSFINLTKLTVIHLDSLSCFEGLMFSDLTYLHIDACASLDSIDVSTLADLSTLRVEDFNSLPYLNTQNGTTPSEIFSLFYTLNIGYACVDSIADEYNLVHSAMIPGNSPSLFCDITSAIEPEPEPHVSVYPNPSQGAIQIDHPFPIHRLRIKDSLGRLILEEKTIDYGLDISWLENGIYTLEIFSKEGRSLHTLIKD